MTTLEYIGIILEIKKFCEKKIESLTNLINLSPFGYGDDYNRGELSAYKNILDIIKEKEIK